MSTNPPPQSIDSCSPCRAATQAGFSTLGIFLSIMGIVAGVALIFGYFLQLTSRLTLAESRVRLLQVNQELLTQQLEIERQMDSKTGREIEQLAKLQVVALHPSPSPWKLASHFDVVWNENTGIGVLSISGNIEDTAAHDLQLRSKLVRSDSSLDIIPIPTQEVPGINSKRWFEVFQTTDTTLTGFELVMFLGDDSPDTVKFSGDLAP